MGVEHFLHITFLANSLCQSSLKLFLMMSMPSHSCVSVMMRGGANRILSLWVGLHRRPFSASCRQKSQALWPVEAHKKEVRKCLVWVHSSTGLPHRIKTHLISLLAGLYKYILCISQVNNNTWYYKPMNKPTPTRHFVDFNGIEQALPSDILHHQFVQGVQFLPQYLPQFGSIVCKLLILQNLQSIKGRR